MKINKLNYEVYAIDYIEGTLPEDMVTEMEQFLLLNPEVAKDIAIFNNTALVPDLSVQYLAKDDLKKPVQFAILNYMNWIVPIGMSIAFMVAYPSLQTLWNADEEHQEQPTVELAIQQHRTSNADESVNITQHQEENDALNTTILSDANTSNRNASVQNVLAYQNNKKENKNYRAHNNPQTTTLQPVTTQKASVSVLKDENGTLINEVNNQSLNSDGQPNDESEEKSIVDFGNRDNVFNSQGQLIEPLKTYVEPLQPLSTSHSQDWDLEHLYNEMPLPTTYISFNLMYSMGYDMAKTTNITSDNQLVRHLDVDGTGEVRFENPIKYGLEANIHVSESVQLGTGLLMTSRKMTYYPSLNTTGSNVDLGIQFRNWAIPFTAGLKLPVKGSNHHAIIVKGGIELNVLGSTNYEALQDVGISAERAGTASLLQTADFEDKMLTTDNPFKALTAMKFGLEYERTLPKGALIFGIEYNRQMSNMGTVSIWDYDLNANRRLNPTSYNLRFETVSASVKYVLPYKVRF
jgi:hypothetical protein